MKLGLFLVLQAQKEEKKKKKTLWVVKEIVSVTTPQSELREKGRSEMKGPRDQMALMLPRWGSQSSCPGPHV